MWLVILTKKPIVNDYRSDYFPRKFYYKHDAVKLVEEVKAKGGDAEVVSNNDKK